MMDELLEEMVDPAPSRHEVARRRRAWATGAVLVLAGAGATSLTTSALFTDQDPLSGSISTGTVVLTSDDPTFDVPLEGIAPGGTTVAPLLVRNTGSLELRYSVSLEARSVAPPSTQPPFGPAGSGDLTDELRVRILRGVTCTTAGVGPAEATNGQVIADVGKTTENGPGLPATMTPILGDPAPGQDDPDGRTPDRVLASQTDDEPLCIRVDMWKDAGNEYQNTAAELTFRLDSEQTVNNP